MSQENHISKEDSRLFIQNEANTMKQVLAAEREAKELKEKNA